jgi:hypothetical protein
LARKLSWVELDLEDMAADRIMPAAVDPLVPVATPTPLPANVVGTAPGELADRLGDTGRIAVVWWQLHGIAHRVLDPSLEDLGGVQEGPAVELRCQRPLQRVVVVQAFVPPDQLRLVDPTADVLHQVRQARLGDAGPVQEGVGGRG